MSDFKPVKKVIVGCGMIASKSYQPRCPAYGRGIRKRTLAGDWEIEASPEGVCEGLDWGQGPSDFADAIRNNRPVRCSGKHARHVLEICERIFKSADKGVPVDVVSQFPAPIPVGQPPPWN